MKYYKYYLLAFLLIIIDQTVKLLVHFSMDMGEFGEIPLIGDWFKLHYTLNEGMAFGIKFGSDYGKLFLTLFRIVAVFAIGYYVYILAKNEANTGFIWCISMILAGAVGNVIDSTFYGVFLENAPYVENTPPFYPWFHGQVVDMFYFDIWQGFLPNWLPLLGGKYYSFWPIFNVADASIFIGVSIILIYQKRFFPHPEEEAEKVENEPANDEQEVPSAEDNASNLSEDEQKA